MTLLPLLFLQIYLSSCNEAVFTRVHLFRTDRTDRTAPAHPPFPLRFSCTAPCLWCKPLKTHILAGFLGVGIFRQFYLNFQYLFILAQDTGLCGLCGLCKILFRTDRTDRTAPLSL